MYSTAFSADFTKKGAARPLARQCGFTLRGWIAFGRRVSKPGLNNPWTFVWPYGADIRSYDISIVGARQSSPAGDKKRINGIRGHPFLVVLPGPHVCVCAVPGSRDCVRGPVRKACAPRRRTTDVTIIVTAYNEEKCIQTKLDNLAELNYPPTPRRNRRIRRVFRFNRCNRSSYNRLLVRVLRLEGRQGKTACQNAAAPQPGAKS